MIWLFTFRRMFYEYFLKREFYFANLAPLPTRQHKTLIENPIRFNKGRFCNTIASVALVHTSIQSD